jgi:pimeloyl-ACP methyl ester carboxylesterase
MKKTHLHLSDIHGYSRLAVEATLGVTDLVEAMHHNILRLPLPFGKAAAKPASAVHGAVYQALAKTSGFVYQGIRGVTTLIGGGLDAALAHLEPELAHLNSSDERAAIVSILNGVLGDHMNARGNPLTIQMGFRHQGKPLALTPEALRANFQAAQGKVLVLLHGHCMNELHWTRNGHNHGEVLAAAHGYTPVYLRYNSGLHISQNGRSFADQLEALVQAWPCPVTDICLLGYSMGGLVARSAFHYGALAQHGWMAQVNKLLFVGTPHHGSMVEQVGNLVDLALEASPYSEALSRLGKIRSAGTTDLRHGNLIDEDWEGRNRFAHARDQRQPSQLPPGVRCHAIAAMIAKEHCEIRGKLFGDGLVPLKSALGQHIDAARALAFPKGHSKVFYGLSHLGLLDSPDVCAQLGQWLAQPDAAPARRAKKSGDAQAKLT